MRDNTFFLALSGGRSRDEWSQRLVCVVILQLAIFCHAAVALEISGYAAAEARFFVQSPALHGQPDTTGSLVLRPEFYQAWRDGDDSLLFIPFARFDQYDSRRTHVDIRELSYIHVGPSWEFRTGVRKVFWGVAESNHLVDIINQTDFVENIDQEDKLGQVMLNLAVIRDWGTVDLFVLPGFRERPFAGRDGRFQLPLRVDTSAVQYESAAADKHVDYALRYASSFGVFDTGLYHFWGTSREPRFRAERTASGEDVFAPIYDIIHQTGADVQATVGSWLFKLEALHRSGQGDAFFATVGGFEYTLVGVFGSVLDLGLLGEYHFDERGESALTGFDHDVFVGSRLAANDAADSQLLAGLVNDLNGQGQFVSVEASRRLGDRWKLEVEMRWFLGVVPDSPLAGFRRDDYVQVELQSYF